jgi:hypothetical protein
MSIQALIARSIVIVTLCAPAPLLAAAPHDPLQPGPRPTPTEQSVLNDTHKQCHPSSASLRVLTRESVQLVVALAFLYWLANVIVRWNRIAHPTRQLLQVQIDALATELQLLTPNAGLQRIQRLLTVAENLISNQGVWRVPRLGDVVFWSRGKEIAGWYYVHEAETQMAQFLALPTVVSRLEAQEQKLRGANDAASLALADSIHRALTATPSASPDRLRVLLAEAFSENYEREDNSFAELVTWQNKTAWLVALGLVLIVVVAGVFPERSVLLLAGAVGGLLSRLSRSLNRKDVPTDYGASWTTLFLSPVAGALGAWAGILVSELAVQFHVLGNIFECTWEDPFGQVTLGIAVVFGFSERLLDTIFDKLVEKTTNSGPSSNGSGGRLPSPPLPGGGGGSTALAPETLPEGKVGQNYTGLPAASGSLAAFVWSLRDGTLPDGLALKTDGSLTGQPAAAAAGRTFDFSARGTGGAAEQVRHFTLKINPAAR